MSAHSKVIAQTDRQTHTNTQTDRQTHTHTHRQTDRQTDTHTHTDMTKTLPLPHAREVINSTTSRCCRFNYILDGVVEAFPIRVKIGRLSNSQLIQL